MIAKLRSAFQSVSGTEGADEASASARIFGGLRHAARISARLLGLADARLLEARLFREDFRKAHGIEAPIEESAVLLGAVEQFLEGAARGARNENERALALAHGMGELLDVLLQLLMELEGRRPGMPSVRRRSGSFYTPPSLARRVVRRALADLPLGVRVHVCDPAVGGGAFLVECCRELAAAPEDEPRSVRSRRAVAGLYGVDRSALAIAVTEVALWLLARDDAWSPRELESQLLVADSLDAAQLFEERIDPLEGFDLVIGNPPWVAFAGRSAQRLDQAERDQFRRRFHAWQGFPTLHGLFVERAAELAPRGRVALLLPSPVADLDGYRATRRALTATHRVQPRLLELGQDAFRDVVQPAFVLVADTRSREAGPMAAAERGERGHDAPWTLDERSRAQVEVTFAPPPACLTRFEQHENLPAECFRELGFQSNGVVSRELFLRGPVARGRFRLPLLEGRRVGEFVELGPQLFLDDSPAELERAGVRLRPPEIYGDVAFVVRQTASVTIAARHGGLAFRNSLIAGFGVGAFDADLLVGLLNSSLFRAIHLGRRRDARQAAFPQVKVAHLRELPRPPSNTEGANRVRRAAETATKHRGCSESLRVELDEAVFDLFSIPQEARGEVHAFVATRFSGRTAAGRSVLTDSTA